MKISSSHHQTRKGTIKKNPSSKKVFYMTWPQELYGDVTDKEVGLEYITEGNGFQEEDIAKIKKLKVGETWREAGPFIGDGATVTRIR